MQGPAERTPRRARECGSLLPADPTPLAARFRGPSTAWPTPPTEKSESRDLPPRCLPFPVPGDGTIQGAVYALRGLVECFPPCRPARPQEPAVYEGRPAAGTVLRSR